MENGKWKMENGKWKMENGKWKMENGKWKMEKYRTVLMEWFPIWHQITKKSDSDLSDFFVILNQ
ncbi:hypothetical protein LP086_02140 [Moraxella bovis]|nr:hypothetical protein [Moraxella bovis]UZA00937.1 hypothetical protein LP086_02140 [Moraxella bovis]UZA08857.1 hypothetical protein LP108_13865 [Moraxella bovis]